MNKKNRREHLSSLAQERRTMIFYEAPHKLRATLSDLQDAFGPQRRIALCRELTKLHEEVIRTNLEEAVRRYETLTPKGEFVLVVEGAPEAKAEPCDLPLALERVAAYRQEGLPLKAAAKKAAEETGLSKNELYAAALDASV